LRTVRHIATLTAAYAVALQLLFGALAAAQTQVLAASGWPPLEDLCASDGEQGGAPHHGKDCTICILQKVGDLPPASLSAFVSRLPVAAVTIEPALHVLPRAAATPRLSQGPPRA
jgi:hypothetical protein